MLARATPDLIYDQMVAAGCARKVIFSYMGNPGVGSLRIVRSAIEQGKLEWEEYSHFQMITRLQAGASGLPFLPMNQTGVVDLERANPNIRRIPDPYGGKDVVVVPALNPDVAIVHVQRADANGNAHLWGIIGEQKEAAFAARKVILTAEEIVDEAVNEVKRRLVAAVDQRVLAIDQLNVGLTLVDCRQVRVVFPQRRA